MTTTTAASPPAASGTMLNDLWYDDGNGNLRSQCVGVMTWQPAGGLTGWTGTHASFIASPQSPYLLLVTADGTGVSGWYVTSPSLPAVPGDTASASCPVLVPDPFDVPVNLAAVYVGVAWLDSGGAVISVTESTPAVVNVGATAQLTVTATGAPAGTVSACVVVGDAEDSAGGTQMFAGPAALAVWSPFPAAVGAMALPLPGAVDDTTVNGALHLNYSTSPGAAGTLIASVAGVAGTDQFGNAYLAGVCNYTPFLGGVYLAVQLLDGTMIISSAAGYGGPYTQIAAFIASGTILEINGTAASMSLTMQAGQCTLRGGPLTLAAVSTTPATPAGCSLYYKAGVLYALGTSGTPVAIATT